MANRVIKENKQFHAIYSYWKWLDVLITITALFGLVVGMVKYELDVYNFRSVTFDGVGVYEPEDISKLNMREMARNSPRCNSIYHKPMIWLMLISTFFSVLLLFLRRYYEVLWSRNYFRHFLHQPNGSLYFFYDK
jgi:hypothetical protein